MCTVASLDPQTPPHLTADSPVNTAQSSVATDTDSHMSEVTPVEHVCDGASGIESVSLPEIAVHDDRTLPKPDLPPDKTDPNRKLICTPDMTEDELIATIEAKPDDEVSIKDCLLLMRSFKL